MKVIRVLVYEGDPEVIFATMERNGVKKFHALPGMTIKEHLIGYAYPQVEKADLVEAEEVLNETGTKDVVSQLSALYFDLADAGKESEAQRVQMALDILAPRR